MALERLTRFLGQFTRGEAMPAPPQPSKNPFLITLGLNNLDINPIKSKRDQLDSYVGWVYACVSTISQDCRSNSRGLWKKTGKRRQDWTPIEKLPEWMRQPNLTDRTWGQFIERRNVHRDMTGEAWWHIISAAPGGKLQGLEMIQPDWIDEPIYNASHTAIEAWWINIPGQRGGRKQIQEVDIVRDFYMNPRDPLRGASPVEAFALSHHFDIYLRAYGVKLVRDGGTVTQVVKTDQDLSPEEADALESRLQRKFRTPGRIGVFGKGASVENPGLPIKDLDFLRTLKPTMDQILAIYKMPRSKFGLTEGAGDTNQKVAARSYEENSLRPRLKSFDEIMNEVILPRAGFSPDTVYESEDPVEADRTAEFKEALETFESGASTVNEFLQAIGKDKVVDGDVRFIPNSVIVVKSYEDVVDDGSEPETPPAPVAPKPDPKDEAADRIAKLGLAMAAQTKASDKAEIARLRKVAAEARFLQVQDAQERQLKAKARQVFTKEDKEVRDALVQNVRSNGSERNERALQMLHSWSVISRIHPAVDQDDHYCDRCAEVIAEHRDWLDEVLRGTKDDWGEIIEEAWAKGIETGAGLFQEEVAGGLSFKVFEERAKRYAKKVAGEKVTGIQGSTLKDLRRVISKGIENGDPVDKIAKAVGKLYDGFKGSRSETIARTEVSNSIGWGKYESAKESERRLGMEIVRTWIATLDDRTREAHASADGQQRKMNEAYSVGGVEMKHPGDGAAPADLVINCRCTETYEDISGQ